MPLGDTIGELGYKLEGEVRRYFRAGDMYPSICATLKRSDYVPVDLRPTASMVVASIAVSMRDYSNPYAIPRVDDQPCTISNATFGQVCYQWQATDEPEPFRNVAGRWYMSTGGDSPVAYEVDPVPTAKQVGNDPNWRSVVGKTWSGE